MDVNGQAFFACLRFFAPHSFRATTCSAQAVDAQKACSPDLDGVIQLAVNNADLSSLVEAVTAANLTDALRVGGPINVFAPTNTAFAALLEEQGGTLEGLLEQTSALSRILQVCIERHGFSAHVR